MTTTKNVAAKVSRRAGSVVERIGRKVDNAVQTLDAYDAAVQAVEGDFVGAALSAAGMFDVGYIGNTLKLNIAVKRADLALSAFDKRGTLRSALTEALGGPPTKAYSAHHVVPVGALDNELVQAAIEGGFDFNGAANGMWAIQKGAHPKYAENVVEDLNELARENADLVPSEAKDLIEGYVSDLKDNVNAAGGIIE